MTRLYIYLAFFVAVLAMPVFVQAQTQSSPDTGAQQMSPLAKKRQEAKDLRSQGEAESAFLIYRELAQQNDKKSQAELGSMYLLGEGTKEDFVQGYKWMFISMNGKPPAEVAEMLLETAESQGMLEEFNEAKQLARQWLEDNTDMTFEAPVQQPLLQVFDHFQNELIDGFHFSGLYRGVFVHNAAAVRDITTTGIKSLGCAIGCRQANSDSNL